MESSDLLLSRDVGGFPDLISAHGRERGNRRALVHGADVLTYAELDDLVNRISAGLHRDGVAPQSRVAIIAGTTVWSVAAFLGALRAGCVPSPLAPSSTPEQLTAMIVDSASTIVFIDREGPASLQTRGATIVELEHLAAWLPPIYSKPRRTEIGPQDTFNIIYSSGTTGTPKGIVHSHAYRWRQIRNYAEAGFADATTIVATPIYSNTTMVCLLPTLAFGGTAVLLGKFDARRFLEAAERERATHVMLVPVQYQRIMAVPDFDRFELGNFKSKYCTSAPFAADLKADIVRRWPGQLTEIYGMTEGGGACKLLANEHPDKLHTVGQMAPGSDIRLIDDAGHEVQTGAIGEVVGRSPLMMTGYHGRPEETAATYWHDADGNRYIRHGDIGRFDEDGFLTLLGRSKDMIISGGFNIYPPDIEAVLVAHPQIAEAAVIGVPSEVWGETPYAFYVAEGTVDPAMAVAWVSERVGKTQRLSGAEQVSELPRSPIGKILKRELRDQWVAT